MKTLKNNIQTVFLLSFITARTAFAGYDIEAAGTTGGSIFQRLVGFMQDIVDMMDGPVAIFVLVVGMIVAVVLWVFAPDNRALGKAFKAIAAAFIIFDIGLLITYIRA